MKALIPVDGSEQSLKTIQMAAQFLDKRSVDVLLLTVIVPMVAEMPMALLSKDPETAAAEILRNAEILAKESGLRVVHAEALTFHEPASAICDYAKAQQIDQIIMGSHGYQGLAKFLMGSVSERVFKQAEQPVIILRNDQTHTVEDNHFEEPELQQPRS